MRKIVVGAFVSLDGVMQAPGGPGEDPTGGFKFEGWVAPHFDETSGEVMVEIFSKPFDLLLGRKTYDIFAAHWPRVTDPDDPIAGPFNSTTKYVATRTPDRKLDWNNSQTLGGDVVAALKQLKQEDGPDLMTQGSTDFIKTLLAHGLVDEFHVHIFPVILGKGKRMFDDGSLPKGLKLISSVTTPSGIISTKYVLDGAVKTGSFALD